MRSGTPLTTKARNGTAPATLPTGGCRPTAPSSTVAARPWRRSIDRFEPFPGFKVNGRFTLGENIGDLSGVTIAYAAYHLSLGGKQPPVIDGLSGDQRFFMGWAQVWRRKHRDDDLRNRLVIDPHSPAEFRVNGTVRNVPAFFTAFGVKEGDKMYLPPKDRVKIW